MTGGMILIDEATNTTVGTVHDHGRTLIGV